MCIRDRFKNGCIFSVYVALILTVFDKVGENRVYPAMSLIEFEKQYQPVMDWIFGQVFVCMDMQTAVEVTYNKNILKKCITLDGDVTDPHGSLSGGNDFVMK